MLKLQFPEHEKKSAEIFFEEFVAEVFLDRSGIPCIRGRILSLVYLYTVILSPREMYFAYHNDAMFLSDTHFCPSQCAALARDRQNCANVSIDVSEGCS